MPLGRLYLICVDNRVDVANQHRPLQHIRIIWEADIRSVRLRTLKQSRKKLAGMLDFLASQRHKQHLAIHLVRLPKIHLHKADRSLASNSCAALRALLISSTNSNI